MRVYPEWVKTTLSEDEEIFRALIEALRSAPNQGQRRILTQVKHHMVDGNRDLKLFLWEDFLAVLDGLEVSHPQVRINANDPETGSYFQVPAAGKTHKGKSREHRLARRKQSRLKQWNSTIIDQGLNPNVVDIELASDDSMLGNFRDEILEELVERDQEHSRLRDQQSTLASENVELRSRVSELEAKIEELSDAIESMEVLIDVSSASRSNQTTSGTARH